MYRDTLPTLSDHLFFRTDAVKAAESPLWQTDDSADAKHSRPTSFVILIGV
jgi:hypothetical protein